MKSLEYKSCQVSLLAVSCRTCPPPLVGEKNVGSKLVLIYVILILSNSVILNFCAAPPGRIVN
jgi:hypothetical protein